MLHGEEQDNALERSSDNVLVYSGMPTTYRSLWQHSSDLQYRKDAQWHLRMIRSLYEVFSQPMIEAKDTDNEHSLPIWAPIEPSEVSSGSRRRTRSYKDKGSSKAGEGCCLKALRLQSYSASVHTDYPFRSCRLDAFIAILLVRLCTKTKMMYTPQGTYKGVMRLREMMKSPLSQALEATITPANPKHCNNIILRYHHYLT